MLFLPNIQEGTRADYKQKNAGNLEIGGYNCFFRGNNIFVVCF